MYIIGEILSVAKGRLYSKDDGGGGNGSWKVLSDGLIELWR